MIGENFHLKTKNLFDKLKKKKRKILKLTLKKLQLITVHHCEASASRGTGRIVGSVVDPYIYARWPYYAKLKPTEPLWGATE